MCFSFLPQGVTYCGESKASTLTMQNVPWHEEVTLLKLLTLPTNSDSFDQVGFNNLDCCPLNFNCLCPLILLHLHWFSFSGEFACPSLIVWLIFLNCPNVLLFFPQVIGFVQKLTDLLPDYEIACEHEHSNCLLICHKKVRVENGTFFWRLLTNWSNISHKHIP